eukprot:336300-Hanusia_phi.AAC.1
MSDGLDASLKREAELRKIVLAWLNRKGYKEVEEAFKKEAVVNGNEPLEEFAFRRGLENDLCIRNYILQWGMEDTRALRYEECYVELREWILKLLEDMKNELAELLYPLFVHCYLDLMSKQYTAEARDLLAHCRHEHEPEHAEEITCLGNILDGSTLDTNPIAIKYMQTAKAKVYLCHESDKLLTEFLHNRRLNILVRLINQYIDIIIYGTTVHDIAPQMRLNVSQEVDDAVIGVKRKPLRWAEGAEESIARREARRVRSSLKETEGNAGDAMQQDEPSNPPRNETEGVQELPQLSEEMESRILSDLKKRVNVSKGALPSICCYTLFNCRDALTCMDISHDASIVAAGMSDSRIKVWRANATAQNDTQDAPNGSIADRLPDRSPLMQDSVLIGHSGPVYSTSISPDNRYILSCSEDKSVRLWQASSGRNLVSYRGHNYPVWDVVWSPLGHYFATASHDRTARIWSTDHIYPLRILAGHLSSVDQVVFHPNCNYVATGSLDKTCRLWDITHGECVRLFKGHRSPISCLAVSPCGKLLASGSDSGELLVWDIASSKCVFELPGHEGGVLSVEFSSGEGSLLASGGLDCTVRLWDMTQTNHAKGTRRRAGREDHRCPQVKLQSMAAEARRRRGRSR